MKKVFAVSVFAALVAVLCGAMFTPAYADGRGDHSMRNHSPRYGMEGRHHALPRYYAPTPRYHQPRHYAPTPRYYAPPRYQYHPEVGAVFVPRHSTYYGPHYSYGHYGTCYHRNNAGALVGLVIGAIIGRELGGDTGAVVGGITGMFIGDDFYDHNGRFVCRR